MAKKINHAKAMNLRLCPADLIRFLRKCRRNKKTGCWIWTGHKDLAGYGQMWFNGSAQWAHRLSCCTFIREIKARQQIDHVCNNPSCVNPDHLAQVSHAQNAARKTRPYAHYVKGREGWDEDRF